MSDGIEIIGAGLGRTGTYTLKVALEQLGFSRCYHMTDLLSHPKQVLHWHELKDSGKTNWQELFGDCRAVVDYPGCLYYREIKAAYPEAKVILTVRDPDTWYESVLKTLYKLRPRKPLALLAMFLRLIVSARFRAILPVYLFADIIIWKEQFKSRFANKEMAIKIFKQHYNEVKAAIPDDQLLVYDVNDGWQPLCEFLNVPIPNIPFPVTNLRQDFASEVENLMERGHNGKGSSLFINS